MNAYGRFRKIVALAKKVGRSAVVYGDHGLNRLDILEEIGLIKYTSRNILDIFTEAYRFVLSKEGRRLSEDIFGVEIMV